MKLTILFIFISLTSIAQINISSNTKLDVALISELYQSGGDRVNDEMHASFPIDKIGGVEYVSFIAKVNTQFTKNELEGYGALVGSQIGGIVSIKFPLDQLTTILSTSNIETLQIAGKVKPMLDKVKVGTRVDSVWAGYGLPQGYTGKDVIIGITDWGFDYSSPMFYDTLLQDTRILAAWDQFKTSGPSPGTYGYGTEYTTPAEFVAAGADTANFYSYATHGSHVAGIAAGSGAGLEHRGMAFEANYLFTTFLFNEAAVLDAWEWMYDRAQLEGKRLVINMSWGIYHMDALDGTSLLGQALDAYSALGVVFVTSAGNNGNVNFHIQKDFASDTLSTKVDFYTSGTLASLWGQSIHMWGEAGNPFESQLIITDFSNNVISESPWYSTSNVSYVDSFVVATGTDTVFFNLSADAAYPTNSRPQTRLRIKFPPGGYKIGIRARATSGKVHFWNLTELTTGVGNWGMPFSSIGTGSTTGDRFYGIGVPACSNTAITVGAYYSEAYSQSTGNIFGGDPASFSSYGPLIDGGLKPDVSAPGANVISSISSYTDNDYTEVDNVSFNGRVYPFAKLSGTSMSSPACAGVAALVLEANPLLSSNQVKSIIIETARQDQHTGVIPPHSDKWGWGKVNALAAVQLAINTVGLNPVEMKTTWEVYPNPTSSSIMIKGLEGDLCDVMILDAQGKIVIQEIYNHEVNVTQLNSGVYFIRVIQNGKVEQIKFVKQ